MDKKIDPKKSQQMPKPAINREKSTENKSGYEPANSNSPRAERGEEDYSVKDESGKKIVDQDL